MAFTPELLRRRARRAYEIGRLRLALPWAVAAGAVGLLGTAATSAGLFGVSMALTAALATAACVWYGRHPGRGVWPGIWVGSLAMLLALFAWVCEARGSSGFLQCQLPCLVAGIVITAGATYHAQHGATPRQSLATLLATVSIATPLALIVCVGVGFGGLLGLAGGLAVGSGPLVVRALRAS
jgi:hypothetical protein